MWAFSVVIFSLKLTRKYNKSPTATPFPRIPRLYCSWSGFYIFFASWCCRGETWALLLTMSNFGVFWLSLGNSLLAYIICNFGFLLLTTCFFLEKKPFLQFFAFHHSHNHLFVFRGFSPLSVMTGLKTLENLVLNWI